VSEQGLKRNKLDDDYVFDAREGRAVSPREILPPISKQRAEQIYFLEGVAWLMDHLVGFRARVDIETKAREEAEKRYPTYHAYPVNTHKR
jgi:hypothetical protein